MTRTTDNPLVTQLVQFALHEQGLYHGKVDGYWGPVSDLAFEQYGATNRYAGIGKLSPNLTEAQAFDLKNFVTAWGINKPRYAAIVPDCNAPAELIAALHWREASGDFGTYLHNGDRLGQPTIHEPKGLYFTNWGTAAIDAIRRETKAFALSGVEAFVRSLPPLCVFAEAYNGEGYNLRGVPDPYVLAGTTGYTAGKFVADGKYDPDAVDGQLGVLPLLRAVLV